MVLPIIGAMSQINDDIRIKIENYFKFLCLSKTCEDPITIYQSNKRKISTKRVNFNLDAYIHVTKLILSQLDGMCYYYLNSDSQ